MNQQFYKNMALWVVILIVILLLVTLLRQEETAPPQIAYSEFISDVVDGDVKEVTLEDGHVTGSYEDGREFKSYVAPEATSELLPVLAENDVAVDIKPKEEGSFWRQVMLMWFPLVLFIGLWIFFIRQMQSGGGKAMSFGKSKARLLNENHNRVTFEDVAGIEESKSELEEIIAFLREPKKFTRLGGRIPKGVLLVGPPGTGKTLLAQAPIAGEARRTVFHRSPVPTSSRCSSALAPRGCATCSSRARRTRRASSSSMRSTPSAASAAPVLGGGHDEREQTLNQLLVEMDGFESNEGVILIAATNRPDVLDPASAAPRALRSPVVVPRPDLKGRLNRSSRSTRAGCRSPTDVDLELQSRGDPGLRRCRPRRTW